MTRHSLSLALQFLLALILCISSDKTLAQDKPHHLRMLGVEQGLSNAIVVDIAQDKHHTLWFATEDGLNRFDLNSFHSYRKTTHPLSADELNCILDDPLDSALWIGTQREGLARLDYTNDSITIYRHDNSPEGLSANSITDLHPASDGNIWIATYQSPVCIIVLVDFWASWCGPCYDMMPELKEVYADYHHKGFEIVDVSLDYTMNGWKDAIEDEELPWVHMSDLNGWNNTAAVLYGVKQIPTNIFSMVMEPSSNAVCYHLRKYEIYWM